MSSALKIVQRQFPQVKKLVDSRRAISISVSSSDVKQASKKDINNCAMALACKKKFSLDGIIVSIKRGYLIKGAKTTRFAIPESVSREITTFDRHAEFAPGEYSLSPISPSQRQGTKKTDRNERKREHKLRKLHFTDNIRAVLK